MKNATKIIISLILIIFTASCNRSDTQQIESSVVSTSEEEVVTEPPIDKIKDTLVVNLNYEPETLDPSLNGGMDGITILSNLFEGLYSIERAGHPVPGVAKNYEISKDLMTYTFYLRDNAKWSDGQPVTAYDFAYAWERVLSKETKSDYAYLLYYIKNGKKYHQGKCSKEKLGIKVKDDLTLEVKLEMPNSFFLSLLSIPTYFPVREDILTNNPEDWTLQANTFVTNGKYKMVEANYGNNFLLEMNEHYWNADKITLKNVDIYTEDDENISWNGFVTGEYDIVGNIPVEEIQPGINNGQVYIFPLSGVYAIAINQNLQTQYKEIGKALGNEKVKKALALLIHRREITDSVRKSGEIPANRYIPSNCINYSEREESYYLPNADLETAKLLLEEAGYPDGKDFPILTYTYNEGKGNEKVAVALREMLGELGIELELKSYPWNEYISKMKNKDYILARFSWIADFNDPYSYLSIFQSANSQNYLGYQNPDYDKIMENALIQIDYESRDNFYHEAENLLLHDLPIIPLFYLTQPLGIQPYIEGVKVTSKGVILFDEITIH